MMLCTIVAAFSPPNSIASAQESIGCAADDSICLQSQYETACRTSSSTLFSCLEWFDLLKAFREESSPDSTKLDVALAYTSLGLSEMSTIPSEKLAYFSESRRIYSEVLNTDPTNIDALYGLSATSDSLLDRITLLRRIISINPSDAFASRSLVRNLVTTNGVSGLLEGTKILAQSYLGMEPNLSKWNVANTVVVYFHQAGADSLADSFLERAIKDIGPQGLREGLSSTAEINVLQVESTLSTLCDSSVISLVGAEYCIESIERLLSIDPGSSTVTNLELWNATMMGINSLSIADTQAQEHDLNWRERILVQIESKILTKGIESAVIYATYAELARGNEEKRFKAIQHAIYLDPTNGEYAKTLGQIYLQNELPELAIEQFELAKDLLPANKASDIDFLISLAQANI